MNKKILIVSQYFYPEQFRINDIAAEWVKAGYEVTVVTGIPNYPQGKFFPGYSWFRKRKEVRDGVRIIRLPIFARGSSAIGMVANYFSFVISGFFWQLFTRTRSDFVFTFEVSPMTQALVGVWFAKKRKIPHYIYVQDLWPENVEIVTGIHSNLVLGPIGKMVNYIYKHSAKIFATSPSFVEEIRKRTPGEEDKVIYWPQYAEDFYQPSEEKSPLIPQDGVLNITFTGNIGSAQGLELLPEAAKILKEKGKKVRFNIVGDGRSKDALIKAIEEAETEDYFSLIGRLPPEEIPAILAASDLAFLSFAANPLFSRTIPAKLQSYMACGCAILGAVEGESARIIEEAGCGLVSRIGSAEDLAEKILEFEEKKEELKPLYSSAALAYCQTHFNKNDLLSQFNRDYL